MQLIPDTVNTMTDVKEPTPHQRHLNSIVFIARCMRNEQAIKQMNEKMRTSWQELLQEQLAGDMAEQMEAFELDSAKAASNCGD